MDLSLTEDQEQIKRVAQEFVQREYSKQALVEMDDMDAGLTLDGWEKAAEMGWPGMLVPHEYGGSGNSLTEVGVVFEELGRGPVPGPYFTSGVLAALTFIEAGTEDQKRSMLPGIGSGRRICSLALTEPDYGWDPESVLMKLERRNGSYSINGTKLFVQDAFGATDLVCAARDGEDVRFVMVDARATGVGVRPLEGFIAGTAEVTFDSVEIEESNVLAGGWSAFQRAMLKAIPILCAYQVGGCEAVFDMSVEYSRTRQQFGRPIGRFQRVQDHIIRLANHLDAARWTTYEALWKLDNGKDAETSVHMAKAVASEGYLKSCDAAHEVHAGIGIDREYGLTFHTRMSRTLYSFLGDPTYHRRKLGDTLGL